MMNFLIFFVHDTGYGENRLKMPEKIAAVGRKRKKAIDKFTKKRYTIII